MQTPPFAHTAFARILGSHCIPIPDNEGNLQEDKYEDYYYHYYDDDYYYDDDDADGDGLVINSAGDGLVWSLTVMVMVL